MEVRPEEVHTQVVLCPGWNDGEHLVHVGFGYSRQFRDDDTVRYRERPEAHLANRFVVPHDLVKPSAFPGRPSGNREDH